jgi:hypothetical protein
MKQLLLFFTLFAWLTPVHAGIISKEINTDPPTFELNLNVYPEAGGNTDGQQKFAAGEEITVSASESENFSFIGWSELPGGEILSTDNPYTFTGPNGDYTLYANFIEVFIRTLTLQVVPEGSGEVTGSGPLSPGSIVMIEAIANEGFFFDSWEDDFAFKISFDAAFPFEMPDRDIALTAFFREAVNCAYSQGYWFSSPNVSWPFDVLLGGIYYTQEEAKEFWPANTAARRAFTQYAAIYLSDVTLSLFPELEANMAIIDQYFEETYPQPAPAMVNRAAGAIGRWIDENNCDAGLEKILPPSVPQSIAQAPAQPQALKVQAFPNPFTTKATIAFLPTESGNITVELYNILGERVSMLFDGPANAGEWKQVEVDGTQMNPGIYLYRVRSGQTTHTGKLFLTQ